MQTIKKVFLTLFFLIIVVFYAHSQETTINNTTTVNSNKLSKKQRHKLIKELNLTREQKATWKVSKKEFKIKQESIKTNSGLTEKEKMEQLRILQRERMEKMRTILTPQQIKIFQREISK